MIVIEIDPNGSFKGIPQQRLADVCGLILPWLRVTPAGETIKNHILDTYQFPAPPLEGTTITDEGVWQYPGDPDLQPVMRATDMHTGEMMYMYQHALVAFLEPGKQPFCTRLD
jgi:hypothetical protein